MSRRRLVIVLSGFPRRSETFALTEVHALVERDLVAAIFATKTGEPGRMQPIAMRLHRRVHRLTADSVVAQAAEAARILEGTAVCGVHGYFAHTPAAVAAELARLLRVPFGFSAHARDARKITRDDLHARARRSACVIACNRDVVREFDGSSADVELIPHGVDLEQFTPRSRANDDPFRLLAVGRLVEKKGFDVLLDAAADLPGDWRLRIVGDGPELHALMFQARTLGIAERVAFCGATTHDALPAEYHQADAVVVPSICDRHGDRDGLPNVVLEAMACGTAVVAADTGAIATAVSDGATGLLVPAGDRHALAERLGRVAADRELRAALGQRARAFVERQFDARRCTDRLASFLEQAYA